MTSVNSTLDRFVDKAGRLYTLPAVALKVLELTDQPKIDLRALKQCIEKDPALTSKLLRVVNSSLFGLSRQVSDLGQALNLLGIRPLKLLVLSFCLPANLTSNLASEVLERYWRHTLLRAVACRELAERYWKLPGDEAFIAGLLQDLGTLVLLQTLDRPYVVFLNDAPSLGGDRLERETQALGFNHCELSARLLDRWGLPNNLIRAIEASGRPANAPLNWATPLADVLRIADMLADYLSHPQLPALGPLLAKVSATGLLDREELAEVVGKLEPQAVQMAEAMALQLPQGEAHYQLIRKAQQQLCAAADDAAWQLMSEERRDDDGTLALWEQTMSLTTAAMAFTGGLTGSARPEAQAIPCGTSAASRQSGATPQVRTPLTATVTGLNVCDREKLHNDLARFAANCRTAREPLSLLLVEIDRYASLVASRGPMEAERLARTLFALCQRLDHPTIECRAVDDCCLAVILPNVDRLQAVTLGNQLLRTAQALDRNPNSADDLFRVSVGVATVDAPAKNFQASNLLAAAQRCLHGAQSSGGTLKSIGVY